MTGSRIVIRESCGNESRGGVAVRASQGGVAFVSEGGTACLCVGFGE